MTERGDEMDASPAHKGGMEEEVDLTLGNTNNSLEAPTESNTGYYMWGRREEFGLLSKT